MINLLPPIEKENLLLDRYKKLTIVLGNAILISLVCLLLILYSLKFYTLSEEAYQKEVLESAEKRYQTHDFLALKDTIQKYNTFLSKIDDFYKKETYLSDALKLVSDIERPKGVYVTNLAIEKNAQNSSTRVVVSGVSNSRDSLIILKDNIEKNPKIENVNFPPDNWIKPVDFNFYLTFDIRPVK